MIPAIAPTRAFATIALGERLPPTAYTPTLSDLVRYSAAAGDYYPPHYDRDAALEAGLPGIVVHGLLNAAWLVRCVTRWAGPDAAVLKVNIKYRGLHLVDQNYVVSGEVVSLRADCFPMRAELDMSGETESGHQSTLARIVVGFPE